MVIARRTAAPRLPNMTMRPEPRPPSRTNRWRSRSGRSGGRDRMATFVFIHGAGDVGWYWHLVAAELTA